MRCSPSLLLLRALLLLLAVLSSSWAAAQSDGVSVSVVTLAKGRGTQPRQAPDRILVRFRPGVSEELAGAIHRGMGATQLRRSVSIPGLTVIKLPAGVRVSDAIRGYRMRGEVLYAQPDYVYRAFETVPNDPWFSALWGLQNTGQTWGTPGADINAPAAWALTTGSSNVVIGVIDTGIDYKHADLAGNVYRNEVECTANGVDDDGNGYADDCHGIDTLNHTSEPFDDNSHGTHVSGTIGATGNNGLGVTGVDWQVKIVACKFLGADGSGFTSGAVECLDYMAWLKDHGVNLVATNNSWGGGEEDTALRDAIARNAERGILFVAAAGNSGLDIDRTPAYPASYNLPNIVAVAATDANDGLATFSNFGVAGVDLGAPGADILSTTPGGGYRFMSGTSMASPHVTGVVGLLAAREAGLTALQRKNRILIGSHPVAALTGKTFSGGRLDALGALSCGNRTLLTRQEPKENELTIATGSTLRLALLSLDCNGAASPGVVRVQESGEQIALRDDGVAPDVVAGDAVYTGVYSPGVVGGTRTLAYPGGDSVVLHVVPAYSAARGAYQWRSISGTSLALNDEGYAALTLPFRIRFGASQYQRLYVSPNGNVSPTGNGMATQYNNQPLPITAEDAVVAPFWDDLLPGTYAGNVYYAVLGVAPRRELVLEWRDMTLYYCEGPLPPLLRFQVVFAEASSQVLFNYAKVEPRSTATCTSPYAGGASASVGIQVQRGLASQYSFHTPSLRDQTTLVWTLASGPAPNPVPRITTVLPSTMPVNGGNFTLTVDGSGFIAQSQVLWNGAARATQWVSATRLTAGISNADLTQAGTAAITVRNPAPGGGDSAAATFTISPAASVTLVAPNGGEAWQAGTTQVVRWSYRGTVGSSVRVELLKGGVVSLSWTALIGSAGVGQYSWVVPASQAPGTDYRVRVTSTSGYGDTSDGNFSIVAPPGPRVTVVAPNGGERWQRGTSVRIQWSASGYVGTYVRLQLYKSNVLVRTIATYAASGSGGVNWLIPATQAAGSDYKVRVTSVTYPTYTDSSDASFTIF